MASNSLISYADMARRVEAHLECDCSEATCNSLRRQLDELAGLDEKYQAILLEIQDAQRKDARLEAKVEYFWTLVEDPDLDDTTRHCYYCLIDFTDSYLASYRDEYHAWEYDSHMLHARMAILTQDMNRAMDASRA
ncbi:hypothetical protein H4R21_001771 [Coemansia helicoidea]|uniref:Uncharacterized protein n=1 Tax=Coemansia helicoidea TaxID=1286919 RepID=A0ACC1LAP8_9FUNG|nr:hypothetical protein H4R21_001771 [Coemansia helicoidea]